MAAAGVACTSDVDCASGNCLGGYCCKYSSNPHCTACKVWDKSNSANIPGSTATDGTCTTCASGYSLNKEACGLPAGATCSASSDCASSYCLGPTGSMKCCASSADTAYCSACGSNGKCATCNAGYAIVGSSTTCSNSNDGAQCTADSGCTSGKCLKMCCSAANAPNCAACGASGQCVSCNVGYALSGTACVVSNGAGAPCAHDSDCSSNTCMVNCCSSSVTSCTLCDTSGTCVGCSNGYAASSGSCVSTTLSPGGAQCASSASPSQCASGYCLNGNCCSSPANAANCNNCGNYGECIDCNSGYYVLSGYCYASLAVASVCDSSVPNMCVANSYCMGGYCCKTNIDGNNCNSCDSSGDCNACGVGYFPSGVQCRKCILLFWMLYKYRSNNLPCPPLVSFDVLSSFMHGRQSMQRWHVPWWKLLRLGKPTQLRSLCCRWDLLAMLERLCPHHWNWHEQRWQVPARPWASMFCQYRLRVAVLPQRQLLQGRGNCHSMQ